MAGFPEIDVARQDFSGVPGVLGGIVAERVRDYAGRSIDPGARRQPERRFEQALRARREQGELKLIAEVKRASPSQGAIAPLVPADAAQAYQAGGAAAISCLTEPRHFGGSPEALREVVAATRLPVMRKDFVVHPAMLREAAEWGAAACLLMVSVLGQSLGAYLELAEYLGLDALVEVHDEAELELALGSGARIIGVNNRDLRSLDINLDLSPRLLAQAQAAGFTGVLVAESGYRTSAELACVRGHADAVLVGSSLAGSGDLERATRDLLRR